MNKTRRRASQKLPGAAREPTLKRARARAAAAIVGAVLLTGASIAIAQSIPSISLNSPTSFPVDI